MSGDQPAAGSNPYQSPAEVDDSAPPLKFDDKLRIELMRLHAQMLVLGLSWMAVSLAIAPVCLIFVNTLANSLHWVRLVSVSYLSLDGALLLLGLLTCCRQVWAIYLALGISYLFIPGLAGAMGVPDPATFALLALLFLAFVIRRGHRVVGMARRVSHTQVFD